MAQEVIDLSTLKKPQKPKLETVPPLSKEDEERLEALAAAHPEDAPESRERVTTAFLVLVMPNSEVVVGTLDSKVVLDRPPTSNDVYGACATVQRDIQAMVSAQQTAQLQIQLAQGYAQQAAQAQQAQQVLAKLPPNLGKR